MLIPFGFPPSANEGIPIDLSLASPQNSNGQFSAAVASFPQRLNMFTAKRTATFGPYRLDLHSAELQKFGTKVRMGEQTFQILRLLLEAGGELVTREQIRDQIWGNGVFVDFDHGLNSAVQRLRDALSDSAEKPNWIETVPRRGYRFIGQVTWSEETASSKVVDTPKAPPEPPELPAVPEIDHSPSLLHPIRAVLHKRKLLLVSTFVVVICVIAAFNFRKVHVASRIHSIAVLPLVNLSGDSSQEYFADGMTDELITALAQNHSLRVVSRTSAMQFKGVQRSVREIASELGVDGVLEGSVSRTSNRIHMTVQLIYAPSDSHVWAESYDRDLNQALSLPEELSQTIAKEVQSATAADVPQRHINPEAHDAYMRGRYFWFAGSIPDTLAYFEKAIKLQPDYAAAWAGLSDTYALRGVFGGVPPKEDLASAGATARKAVELDDSLAEAHLSVAAWYMWSWNPLQADTEARRAIELNPVHAESHFFRHLILLVLNRRDEALQEEKRAVELDPFARSYGLGQCYIALRQFDAAIDELRMQAHLHPESVSVHGELSEAYWHKGEYNKSSEELEKALRLSGQPQDAAAVHHAFERGGAKAVAQWTIDGNRVRARRGYVSPCEMASAFAYAGNKDETLHYLEAAYRERTPALVLLQTQPEFDFLHTDSRYRALVREIGLIPSE